MPQGGRLGRVTSEFVLKPRPEYLIDEILPRSGFGTVYGRPKTKKTFYVLDLCYHVAAGKPYRGHEVLQGPVVYVPYEGEEGVVKRWIAIRQHYGWNEEKPAFGMFEFNGSAPPLVGKVPRDMVTDILEWSGGEAPVMVVLDTVGRSLKGSVSKDDDMSSYIRSASIIKDRFKCLVLVVHHRAKNTMVEASPLGSVLMGAANDVQILVENDPKEDGVFSTEIEVLKEGPSSPPMWHHLKIVSVGRDERGKEITSGVVTPLEATRVPKSRIEKAMGPNTQFQDRLPKKALRTLSTLGPSENGTEVKVDEWREVCFRAGQMWDKLPAKPSMTKGFTRAMERLHEQGLIAFDNKGHVSIVGRQPDNVVEVDFREK
jgi:AAA domain